MRRVLILTLSLAVVTCVVAVRAFAQSPGSSTPAAAASPANPSPPVVHYHYHYHAPMSSASYPPYSADPYYSRSFNASNPQAPPAFSPTQANPYPAGYIPGPFAPTGFQNFNPNAPRARGVIDVFLPTKKAVVCLNGQKMRGTGKVRKFTTPVLPANQEYQYWVTATFNQNGESVTQYRKVEVGAGEYNVADFTRPPEETPIHLPAGPVNQNQAFPAQPE